MELKNVEWQILTKKEGGWSQKTDKDQVMYVLHPRVRMLKFMLNVVDVIGGF